MKCPYCHEEIEDNIKICPICSEKIPRYMGLIKKVKEVITVIKNTSCKCQNKLVMIRILLLTISFILSYVGYNMYKIYMSDPTYKTIVAHEHVEYYDYPDSAINVINKVIAQNNDMIKFIHSKNLKEKKELVFNTYFDNITFLGSVIADKIQNGDYRGIKFDNKANIESPKLPMYKVFSEADDIEGWIFALFLDWKYLNETFASYLGSDWKEYLTIMDDVEKKFNGDKEKNGLLLKKKLNAIIFSEKFIKKYPKFERIKDINPLDITMDVIQACEFDLLPKNDVIRSFQDYFKAADNSTDSYKYLQQSYDVMKRNNFKPYNKELSNIRASLFSKLYE